MSSPRAVASIRLSGRWTVRADGVTYRVRRDGACGFTISSGQDAVQLVHRDGVWRIDDDDLVIRSVPAGDNVRRQWDITADGAVLHATETGTGRSAVRQLGQAFSLIPFHLLLPTAIGTESFIH